MTFAVIPAKLRFLLAFTFLAALPLPSQDGPLLTNIAAIKLLAPAEAGRKLPVRVRGVAPSSHPLRGDFFVHDNGRGVYVDSSVEGQSVAVGDLLEIKGVTDPGGFAPMGLSQRIRKLGTAPLPDVLFLDAVLPDVDGPDWVIALRHEPPLPSGRRILPAVVVGFATGVLAAEEQRWQKAGVAVTLPRPVTVPQLRTLRLETCLAHETPLRP